MRNCLWILLASVSWLASCTLAQHTPTPAEQKLVEWVLEAGGALAVEVGPSPQGVRGLRASRFVPKGGLLASLPAGTAITLGSSDTTAPELAVALLRERYRRRPRHAEHIAALPPPGSLLCAEALPPSLTHLLASEELEELVATKRAWLKDVWEGDGAGARVRLPLARALPEGVRVGLAQLAWAACVAGSRTIRAPSGGMLLIPVIDMANHARNASHELRVEVERTQDSRYGGSAAQHGKIGEMKGPRLALVAGHDVAAGDEVCISYGNIRPDEALLYYGFVPETGEQQLAAADHTGWDPASQPGKQVLPEFSGTTAAQVQAEIDRLQARMSHIQRVWGAALETTGEHEGGHLALSALTASLCGTTRRRSGVKEAAAAAAAAPQQEDAEHAANAPGVSDGRDRTRHTVADAYAGSTVRDVREAGSRTLAAVTPEVCVGAGCLNGVAQGNREVVGGSSRGTGSGGSSSGDSSRITEGSSSRGGDAVAGDDEHDDQYAFPCSKAVKLLQQLARARLAGMGAQVDRLSHGRSDAGHEEL